MNTPIIVINFKTYETSTGDNAVKLAKICEKVAKETHTNIIVAVQIADIYRVSQAVSIPVFAQHIDDNKFGAYTGYILAEAVKQNGAKGTLLNHSERRIRLDILEASIRRAKDTGLITVVCANDQRVGAAIAALDADFIAVEPPELIGGNISVSSAKPEVIAESVKRICGPTHCSKVLVGAGIKTTEDVKKALELGAGGILVASGITQAKDPETELRNLVKGIK